MKKQSRGAERKKTKKGSAGVKDLAPRSGKASGVRAGAGTHDKWIDVEAISTPILRSK